MCLAEKWSVLILECRAQMGQENEFLPAWAECLISIAKYQTLWIQPSLLRSVTGVWWRDVTKGLAVASRTARPNDSEMESDFDTFHDDQSHFVLDTLCLFNLAMDKHHLDRWVIIDYGDHLFMGHCFHSYISYLKEQRVDISMLLGDDIP